MTIFQKKFKSEIAKSDFWLSLQLLSNTLHFFVCMSALVTIGRRAVCAYQFEWTNARHSHSSMWGHAVCRSVVVYLLLFSWVQLKTQVHANSPACQRFRLIALYLLYSFYVLFRVLPEPYIFRANGFQRFFCRLWMRLRVTLVVVNWSQQHWAH